MLLAVAEDTDCYSQLQQKKQLLGEVVLFTALVLSSGKIRHQVDGG